MSHPVTLKHGSSWLIRDAETAVPIENWLFDADELAARGLLEGTSQGRRSAWFFHHAGMPLVLRHYWRGGMVARLSADVHAWWGLHRSRPYRELLLLRQLREAGLPVPLPIASRVVQHGLGYRGDLITATIPDSDTFAQRIMAGEARRQDWETVGHTIRRFHDHGASHADLNVRNILLDNTGAAWLIDWDQGRWRNPKGGWQQASMARLRRSLSREPVLETASQEHWDALEAAYHAG